MDRHEEIRYLNSLDPEEVVKKSGDHLRVMNTVEEIDIFFAKSMISLVENNNRMNQRTVAIFPFGPTGQYPYFVQMINEKSISLENIMIFFMDEYADVNDKEIPENHPLSFRGKVYQLFSGIDKNLLPDFSGIVFPSSDIIHELKDMIIHEGPVQVCYGGIGIHGHLAFNEPEKGVRNTDPRLVDLNKYTVTINAIREHIGGNVINFPRKAFSLGMNQIMDAKKIILSCRNGLSEIDWANTTLRLALLGEPGDDFPATYLREVNDYVIVTDKNTLQSPCNVI